MLKLSFAVVLLAVAAIGCRFGAHPTTAAAEIPSASPLDGSPRDWRGLRVGVLGDSISACDQTSSQNVYWQYLAKWLDWTPGVHAFSGAASCHLPGQIDAMSNEMGDEVDAILLLIGTNDYASDTPLGVWYDTAENEVNWWGKEQRLPVRTWSRDPATFRGRLNLALEKLRRRYPDSQIVLMTPLHRAYFYYSPTNIQPTENAPNHQGLFIDDYVRAVREAGSVWSCPVIDLYGASGLMPALKETHGGLFRSADKDRLHPNTEGHRRVASLIYTQLRSYPATFRTK